MELRTERLLLRRWRRDDVEPFATMNADPVVMEHFPRLLTSGETAEMIRGLEAEFDECGFGLWAAERREDHAFIGFIGLHRPAWEAAFTPCVEVGWRLAVPYWGKGYATEGARAVLAYGFESLGLPEIVSFTIAANTRSWHVMEKLGMTRNPADDFDHPRCLDDDRLRRHVLYRITAAQWRARGEKVSYS